MRTKKKPKKLSGDNGYDKICHLFRQNNKSYYKGYECKEILELLKKYEVRRCYYGHLHGGSHGLAMQGQWGGIEFRLVAADYIGFKPQLVNL